MKDISKKFTTLREATALAVLKISPETIDRIQIGDLPKQDPFPVARVAGIQAAKNASMIIPYCHRITVDFVEINFATREARIEITATARAVAKTGVEMEALAGASIAALTLYDMLKAIDDSMEIEGIKLLEKKGGKSDFARPPERSFSAAVLVISDRVSGGEMEDTAGPVIKNTLAGEGFEIVDYSVIPDDEGVIREVLLKYVNDLRVSLVITTGGTGIGPRDSTPEVLADIIEKPLQGLTEALRAYGQLRTPFAMLSRSLAGLSGQTLIIALPGSKRSVEESMVVIFPAIHHALEVISGDAHQQR